MTAIKLYEAVLIELNKVKAPSMSLSDFVYYFNKATQIYMNQMYNAYEVNQQKVDDLRVIRNTAILPAIKAQNDMVNAGFFSDSYEVELPNDYWHMLNCIIKFRREKVDKCDPAGSTFVQGAKRLTSDSAPHVIHNHYMKPSYKNPYYYINNVPGNAYWEQPIIHTAPLYKIEWGNDGTTILNNPISMAPSIQSTYPNNLQDLYRELLKIKNGFVSSHLQNPELLYINQIDDYTIEISHPEVDLRSFGLRSSNETHNFTVEKDGNKRYGNHQKVRMELRFGENQDVIPESVYVDYLMAPKQINLTQEEIDDYEDNSQIIEFPDYVVYEIINILVRLVLEQNSNPARIQSHVAMNDSVANPAAQQK